MKASHLLLFFLLLLSQKAHAFPSVSIPWHLLPSRVPSPIDAPPDNAIGRLNDWWKKAKWSQDDGEEGGGSAIVGEAKLPPPPPILNETSTKAIFVELPTYFKDKYQHLRRWWSNSTSAASSSTQKENSDSQASSIANNSPPLVVDSPTPRPVQTVVFTAGPPPSLDPPNRDTPSDFRNDEFAPLLPAPDILSQLYCRPITSFSSCMEHCLSVLPSSGESDNSLNYAFLPEKGRRRLLDQRGDDNTQRSHLNNTNNKPSRPQTGKSNSKNKNGMEPWQADQFKACLFGVCVLDYVKNPLPGCLGPDGHVANSTRTGTSPEDGEFDYYDPKRLEMWSKIGIYKWSRLWHELTGQSGLSKFLFLPIFILAFCALPTVIFTVVLPAAARLLSLPNSQEESSTHHCRIGECGPEWQSPYVEFVDYLWLKFTEPVIDRLGNLSERAKEKLEILVNFVREALAARTIDEGEIISTEMVPTEPPRLARRKLLLTHGEQQPAVEPSLESSTVATLDIQ